MDFLVEKQATYRLMDPRMLCPQRTQLETFASTLSSCSKKV